jgi:two-component system sensor histidine kinase GlrK
MRIGRPRSLSGLLLIGVALVALPLVAAVVYATLEMESLTRRSEALVHRGVEVTHETQELMRLIPLLEGSAGLYHALGERKDKEAFVAHAASFREALAALRRVTPAREPLVRLGADLDALAARVASEAPGSAALGAAINAFKPVGEHVERLRADAGGDLNAELAALGRTAAATERRLYWQALLLLPGTLVIVLAFVFRLARPLRDIDRAISELGRGTFSRPIAVRGPSDLEQLGRQLDWLRVRLLDLAQEKNRFLRHMSHELKTPLANIREGTELLVEGAVGPLDENQREVANILRENGIQLQRMIENLLSFSAWQAKAVGLELSEFRLRALLRSVVSAQQLTLIAHRVRLDVDVHDLEITADRAKLRLILDNLMSNAVKYTPREGTIFLRGRADGEHLILEVADTGPGIPADERAHVFDAFYTGTVAPGGPVKGTGIGLSVVLEFVEAHGGSIELVHGVYRGAHFRIRLPARPVVTPAAAAPAGTGVAA